MGIDYSYEIFLPPRNIPTALTQLADLAPPNFRKPPLPVTLPGGEQVVVPFTSRFQSDPVDVSGGGPLHLETVLMVPVDDAVRKFYHRPDPEIDESGRTWVGIVYLTVRFAPSWHPDFASMQFTAAVSDMSRMFLHSASVRKVFTDLTAAGGGVCCLLDRETDTFEICWLRGEPVEDTVPGPRFAKFHDLVAAWREPLTSPPPSQGPHLRRLQSCSPRQDGPQPPTEADWAAPA